jgi:AraC-like DNA-binding protein
MRPRHFPKSAAVLRAMDSIDGRIVVMRPGDLAAGAVVHGGESHGPKAETELIAGHDMVLFVARGEGTYRVNGHSGVLRPNTLLAVPAGMFACDLSEDREMYIVATRDPSNAVGNPKAFNPFVERTVSPSEGRQWGERMADYAERAAAGRFGADHFWDLKNRIMPYVWRREQHDAQETLRSVFASIWDRVAEPLTLERLAGDVGYTANYLNDLTRMHTGRALGSWITEMRMARARMLLEHTDLPIAELGATCGYDDPAYFSRAFRRAHGVPPATWRIATRPVDSRYAEVTIPIDVLHEIEVRAALPQREYSFAS